ncbi:MAG: FAD-linked oxidase C-terminal domain-containing protein, partial [Myxococcota bacterium]
MPGEAHALAVGVVPGGGGTGKAGACIPRPDEVVVDLSQMNRILEIHPADGYAVVEGGVINAVFDRELNTLGYMYPPDPASRESCTLGGNIATNAGGPRALKYGVTANYVWGTEVVLPGGDVVRPGRRSIKGVAGLNISALMVGSEGTLGFVSRATLRIVPMPRDVQTAWLSFVDAATASRAAEKIFAAGLMPRMMEVLDRLSMDLVRPVSTFQIPKAGAALLVETDGPEGYALNELTRLCEIATDHGAQDSAVATNEKQRLAMRRARQLVSSRMKEAYPHKISDDIAVPRSQMVTLLDYAEQRAAKHSVTLATYGHMGDGNLHINLLCDKKQRPMAEEARTHVLKFAISIGGTISGEHGIGLTKRHQLPWQQASELLTLQQTLKHGFDPQGIMNRGK